MRAGSREMFERVPEPKALVDHPGRNHEIRPRRFGEITARSAEWMAETLAG